jgi:putative toxin-antitoxin system antitoxin component (TIGR02293 family)
MKDKNVNMIPTDNNLSELIKTVRSGITFNRFHALSEKLPFSMTDWSGFLNLSDRTFQRYKKDKKRFDPIHTEKILEIVLLYYKGIEVFGDPEKFDTWLNLKNVAMGNDKPIQLLDNSFGIRLISDELIRIENGILA